MAQQVPNLQFSDGHTIPQIGFGMWQTDPKDVDLAVNTALEAGYRHIDTAAIYGNEKDLGKVLQKSGMKREELFITTKLWNNMHGYDNAFKAIDESLDKLQMDYVDLYLIHWPEPKAGKYLETWDALVEIQKQGKAKSIGVSNFTKATLGKLVEHSPVKPVINQIEIHPTFNQAEMREINKQYGILTEAWSPLGQGKNLTNPVIVEIAEKHQMTPAQAILCWHLALGNVVIPKSVTPARIKENIESLNYSLTEDDIAKINQLTDPAGRLGGEPDEGIGF